MRKMTVILTSMLVACAAAPRSPTTSAAQSYETSSVPIEVMKGKLVGYDGKPLVSGSVSIPYALAMATPEKDGTFTLDLPPNRLFLVDFAGAGHRSLQLPIAAEHVPVEVEVHLGTYTPIKDPKKVLVILTQEGQQVRSQFMSPAGDGTFKADIPVPDGDYEYDFAGVREAYDGTRDAPEIHVTGGHAKIVFDPRSIPPASEPTVAIGAPGSVERKVADLGLAFAKAESLVDSANDTATYQRLAAQVAPPFLEVAKSSANDAHPLVRQLATMAYFSFTDAKNDEERALAKRFAEEVKPDDAAWALGTGAPKLLRAAGRPEVAAAVIEQNDDTATVGAILLSQLVDAQDDPLRAHEIYQRLRDVRFSKTSSAVEAAWYDPDRSLAPGKAMPAWEIPDLAGAKIKSAAYADKTYLMEVWATWCHPCIADMPALIDAYSKYGPAKKKGKHLDIISISIDDMPKDVLEFRKKDKTHAMPWPQAIVPESYFQTSLGLEHLGVPFYILVDHGAIVATSPTIKADQLATLLDPLMK